jgi:WD40 repeat protein
MSGLFTLARLTAIQERAVTVKYLSCSLFSDHAALGTSTGATHIFHLSSTKPATTISFPGLTNPITIVSFSPNGRWIALGDSAAVHLIDDPLTSPSLFFSMPLKQQHPTSVCWLSDPPMKLMRSHYLLAGDEE